MSSIGSLRHRLEFLDPVRADDGAGGFTRSNSAQITVWGHVRPATAREQDAAGHLEQRVTHKGRIRWRSDLNPQQGQTVQWTDMRGTTRRLYVFAAVDPGERGRWVDLDMREGGPL